MLIRKNASHILLNSMDVQCASKSAHLAKEPTPRLRIASFPEAIHVTTSSSILNQLPLIEIDGLYFASMEERYV
jgi:hypothetical protein